jgi:hypothetical protein
MADIGIGRIDDLLAGTGGDISATSTTAEATAAIQELLHGHGYKTPLMRGPGYGTYNDVLKRCVKAFRVEYGLGDSDSVNQATLKKLVDLPATRPVVSRPYLTLVLDVPYTGYAKLVSLVAIVEGAGRFAAMALNTDKAGLSIGIIQWAQKPKRLAELVKKLDAQAKAVVRPLLGIAAGDDAKFNSLITHLESTRGGTDGAGESTDRVRYNLIVDPWKSQFRNVCLNRRLQKVQVAAAIAAFQASHMAFPTTLALLTSEKSVGLALDVANQFGDGGLRRLAAAASPGVTTESALQANLAAKAVEKLNALFPTQSVFAKARVDRSDFILKSAGLSDSIFSP